MAKIIWDQVGEKIYETGIDKGVLYHDDGSGASWKGVAWNGLTSVDENPGEINVTPYYIDGVKYYNERSVGDYSATLKAFTYPDEFSQYDGWQEHSLGFFLDNQPVQRRFGLSYRTLIGDDVQGTDLGYKLHLAFDLTAKPSEKSYGTLNDSSDISDFTWEITGLPQVVAGYRPTTHVVLDSRKMDSIVIKAIEDILYGTVSAPARFPPLSEVIDLINILGFNVVDNGDGTWGAMGATANLTDVTSTSFGITWPNITVIDVGEDGEDDRYTITT